MPKTKATTKPVKASKSKKPSVETFTMKKKKALPKPEPLAKPAVERKAKRIYATKKNTILEPNKPVKRRLQKPNLSGTTNEKDVATQQKLQPYGFQPMVYKTELKIPDTVVPKKDTEWDLWKKMLTRSGRELTHAGYYHVNETAIKPTLDYYFNLNRDQIIARTREGYSKENPMT